MLRDMTLGQYYPAKSPIHNLDPRTKIVCTIIYIASLFIGKNPILYLCAMLFLGIIIKISKVPIKFMVKGLKSIFMLMLFSVLINMFFTSGEVLVKIWFLKITKEGLIFAFYTIVRLIFLVIGSSLMTLTTTPNKLADGLEKLLAPLKKIKVPVHELSMMMSIALRFIPILMEELDKIIKAQTARCADFDSKNLIKKIKSMIPILVPLFVSAFRRANDLAMAMEARCYNGGDGRTKMRPLIYTKNDIISYLIFIVYFFSMVVIARIF